MLKQDQIVAFDMKTTRKKQMEKPFSESSVGGMALCTWRYVWFLLKLLMRYLRGRNMPELRMPELHPGDSKGEFMNSHSIC